MNARLAILALHLPFFLAGCSESASRWSGTVRDSAGVLLVANTDDGIWDPGEQWTLEEELRIGSAEGEESGLFGVIVAGGVAVDSEERVIVLDAQAQEIRVFSAYGEHLHTMGGRGGGPGELAGARVVLVGAGDTLLVPDRRNQRMNLFTSDGSFIDSSPFSLEDGLSVEFRSNITGMIAEQVDPFVYGQPWSENRTDVIVTLASDGARADTLARFPSGQGMFMEGSVVQTTTYAPEPRWTLKNDGGLIVGRDDEYRFRVYSSAQQLERVVSKPYQARPVTDEDISRIKTHLENRWLRLGAPPEDLPRLWGQQHFYQFLPAFRTIHQGPARTIWVQRVDPPSEIPEDETLYFTFPQDWGSKEWDVFDPEGRYLGVVSFPPRFTPSVFRGDRVYGLQLDTLGVSYVVRLRVVGNLDVSEG